MCVCVRVCAFMCLCVCVGMLDGYCAICVTLQSLLQVTQLNMVHGGVCLTYDVRTCVGVIVLISSSASCLRIVVFPALSKPRTRIFSSRFGVDFNLRR